MKEIDIQLQEAQSPKHVGPKEDHIKTHHNLNTKGQRQRADLKSSKKKAIIYKGASIRLSADFSKETLQARRDWCEVFKVMRSKDLQPRLFYPAKLSFRIKGQIKCFPDKEFIITKPLLYEMLKGLT